MTNDNDWIIIQHKTFLRWINNTLQTNITDLSIDLSSGVVLTNLISKISQTPTLKPIYNSPKFTFQKFENLNEVLEFLKYLHIPILNIGAEDIVEGNLKLILGLIWSIFVSFTLTNSTISNLDGTSFTTIKSALLQWVNSKTIKSDIKVTNFHKDWNDGLALCAILAHYRSDLINFKKINKGKVRGNVELVLSLAENELGIPRLVDVDDFLVIYPDEKSVIAYVIEWYKFFEINKGRTGSEDEEKEKEEEVEENNKIDVEPKYTYQKRQLERERSGVSSPIDISFAASNNSFSNSMNNSMNNSSPQQLSKMPSFSVESSQKKTKINIKELTNILQQKLNKGSGTGDDNDDSDNEDSHNQNEDLSFSSELGSIEHKSSKYAQNDFQNNSQAQIESTTEEHPRDISGVLEQNFSPAHSDHVTLNSNEDGIKESLKTTSYPQHKIENVVQETSNYRTLESPKSSNGHILQNTFTDAEVNSRLIEEIAPGAATDVKSFGEKFTEEESPSKYEVSKEKTKTSIIIVPHGPHFETLEDETIYNKPPTQSFHIPDFDGVEYPDSSEIFEISSSREASNFSKHHSSAKEFNFDNALSDSIPKKFRRDASNNKISFPDPGDYALVNPRLDEDDVYGDENTMRDSEPETSTATPFSTSMKIDSNEYTEFKSHNPFMEEGQITTPTKESSLAPAMENIPTHVQVDPTPQVSHLNKSFENPNNVEHSSVIHNDLPAVYLMNDVTWVDIGQGEKRNLLSSDSLGVITKPHDSEKIESPHSKTEPEQEKSDLASPVSVEPYSNIKLSNGKRYLSYAVQDNVPNTDEYHEHEIGEIKKDSFNIGEHAIYIASVFPHTEIHKNDQLSPESKIPFFQSELVVGDTINGQAAEELHQQDIAGNLSGNLFGNKRIDNEDFDVMRNFEQVSNISIDEAFESDDSIEDSDDLNHFEFINTRKTSLKDIISASSDEGVFQMDQSVDKDSTRQFDTEQNSLVEAPIIKSTSVDAGNNFESSSSEKTVNNSYTSSNRNFDSLQNDSSAILESIFSLQNQSTLVNSEEAKDLITYFGENDIESEGILDAKPKNSFERYAKAEISFSLNNESNDDDLSLTKVTSYMKSESHSLYTPSKSIPIKKQDSLKKEFESLANLKSTVAQSTSIISIEKYSSLPSTPESDPEEKFNKQFSNFKIPSECYSTEYPYETGQFKSAPSQPLASSNISVSSPSGRQDRDSPDVTQPEPSLFEGEDVELYNKNLNSVSSVGIYNPTNSGTPLKRETFPHDTMNNDFIYENFTPKSEQGFQSPRTIIISDKEISIKGKHVIIEEDCVSYPTEEANKIEKLKEFKLNHIPDTFLVDDATSGNKIIAQQGNVEESEISFGKASETAGPVRRKKTPSEIFELKSFKNNSIVDKDRLSMISNRVSISSFLQSENNKSLEFDFKSIDSANVDEAHSVIDNESSKDEPVSYDENQTKNILPSTSSNSISSSLTKKGLKPFIQIIDTVTGKNFSDKEPKSKSEIKTVRYENCLDLLMIIQDKKISIELNLGDYLNKITKIINEWKNELNLIDCFLENIKMDFDQFFISLDGEEICYDINNDDEFLKLTVNFQSYLNFIVNNLNTFIKGYKVKIKNELLTDKFKLIRLSEEYMRLLEMHNLSDNIDIGKVNAEIISEKYLSLIVKEKEYSAQLIGSIKYIQDIIYTNGSTNLNVILQETNNEIDNIIHEFHTNFSQQKLGTWENQLSFIAIKMTKINNLNDLINKLETINLPAKIDHTSYDNINFLDYLPIEISSKLEIIKVAIQEKSLDHNVPPPLPPKHDINETLKDLLQGRDYISLEDLQNHHINHQTTTKLLAKLPSLRVSTTRTITAIPKSKRNSSLSSNLSNDRTSSTSSIFSNFNILTNLRTPISSPISPKFQMANNINNGAHQRSISTTVVERPDEEGTEIKYDFGRFLNDLKVFKIKTS